MKIYYIANARMPTEKAHGIQIAKMCEAFVEQGASVELVVSSRGSGSLEDAYSLTQKIPVRRLPTLDLQFLGPVGYRLTALQFMAGSFLYVWAKALSRERFVVYTVDMDQFSFVPFALIPRPLFAEMHSAKSKSVFRRWFFKRAYTIATNSLIGTQLAQTFGIPPERLCIEPNGVDESALQNVCTKIEARRRLGLPNAPFALYVGRFYAWKGLEILADAAETSPLPICVVGGTQAEYEAVTRRNGGRLRFVGARPVAEIPLWLAAADVLLVLGTARNEDSYRYTAPMKIFEYLAAHRPMVASRTPAITSIVKEDVTFWYEPDDAESLVEAIREAHTSPEALIKAATGRALAAHHTWRARAKRILSSPLSWRGAQNSMMIGIVTGFSAKHAAGLEEFLLNLLVGLDKARKPWITYRIYTRAGNGLQEELYRRGLGHVPVVAVSMGPLWKSVGLLLASRSDVYLWNGPLLPLWTTRRSAVLVYDFAYRHFGTPVMRLRFLDFFSKCSFRMAKKIITISHATRKELVRHYDVPAEKIEVIYPGLKDFSSVVEEPISIPSQGYFLFVGTTKERKNVLNLIQGFARIADRTPQHLLVAGRCNLSSPYGRRIEAFVKKKKLEDRIRFLGSVNDGALRYLYRHAFAFAFPSAFEGFGMPVVEAMSEGAPVLTSNVSSLPEAAGDAALLVNPFDPEAIGAGLLQLAENADLRHDLIEKGFANARRFSWETSAKRFLEVLSAL